jgi:hypothetical protein
MNYLPTPLTTTLPDYEQPLPSHPLTSQWVTGIITTTLLLTAGMRLPINTRLYPLPYRNTSSWQF